MADSIHIPSNISKTMSTAKVARTARQGMGRKQKRHKRALKKTYRERGQQNRNDISDDTAAMGSGSDPKTENRKEKNTIGIGAGHQHLHGNIIDIHI